MNYTEKYHLPQWEESDRVMRTDFNQMCANIENGIRGVKTEAQKAQSDVDSLAQTVGSQGEILSSHEHYVIGTYTGTTGTTVIDTLEFRPRALLIGQVYHSQNVNEAAGSCALFLDDGRFNFSLQFLDNGFSLYYNNGYYPIVNKNGIQYIFVAFK